MGRRPQPERRTALLDACVRHVLDRGLAGLSISSMAAAAGTSPRMLIYHFGAKEKLVRAALEEVRRRQHELFDGVLHSQPGVPYPDVLKQAWILVSSDEAMPYHHLFRELHDLPVDASPWPEFAGQTTYEWLPVVERGLKDDGYHDPEALATLLVATVRGLLVDLHDTGDRTRADAALGVLTALLNIEPAVRGNADHPGRRRDS
jgi:AcrR family transcriptional regulator